MVADEHERSQAQLGTSLEPLIFAPATYCKRRAHPYQISLGSKQTDLFLS